MKRNIYIFSPLPPQTSGISEYTHVLAEHLSRIPENNITVVVDQQELPPDCSYRVAHWKDFLYRPFAKSPVLIYQVGNHPMHQFMYPFLFSHPGIAIVHDYVLAHGRLDALRTICTPDELTAELRYELGRSQGEHLAEMLRLNVVWSDLPHFARLNRTIVATSQVTVSHNPDTALALAASNPNADVRHITMAFWQDEALRHPSPASVVALRRAAGIMDTDFVIGSFGAVGPYKQIDVLMLAVKRLRSQGYPVKLLIVGYQLSSFSVSRMAQDFGIHHSVLAFSNAGKSEYWKWILASDVCCSLRFPAAGEFSLSTLELMAAQKTVIVNRHRFNAFIPENVCRKISTRDMVDELVDVIRRLFHSPGLRKAIGAEAGRYVQENHNIGQMIQGYQRLIESYVPGQELPWKQTEGLPDHLVPLRTRTLRSLRSRFGDPPPPLLERLWDQAL